MHDKDERDEEGLLRFYDVVICGTGLVQSILASALTRAGKSVLHCDGSDSYGELDGTIGLKIFADTITHPEEMVDLHLAEEALNFPSEPNGVIIPMHPKGGESTLQLHSQSSVAYCGFDVGSEVDTPFGIGTVTIMPKTSQDSLVVALKAWVLADGKRPLVYFRLPCSCNQDSNSSRVLERMFFETHGVQSTRTSKAKQILNDQHRFSLDLTPAFVLASGQGVSGMLASNVADYLEFRSAEGLFWLEDGKLSKVPCSKNDVFATKLLAPMEKRRLMKFIQFAMDYATQLSSEEERHEQMPLQEKMDSWDGSSTAQNRATTMLETEVQSLNERHLNHGRSLARPQNKVVSTEAFSSLRQCVDEGMDFDTFLTKEYKLSPRLRAIVRFAIAWELEKSSVSLAEGMRNLKLHLQAIGRFGSTAFIYPLYGSGELPQAFCRSAAVFGATYLLRRAPIGIRVSGGNHVCGVLISDSDSSKCKTIECSAVIASSASFSAARSTKWSKRVLRRVSVVNGRLFPSADTDCHVTIIPPNSEPIGNAHTIHCVTLDHTLHVVPPGCSVVHLTTTVASDEGLEGCSAMLSETSRMIIEANGNQIDELYQVCYSYSLEPTEKNFEVPEGLYHCHHRSQMLAADDAFAQAENIFSKLCPGKEFLRLSEDFDNHIMERATENNFNDDEKYVLESALEIVRKYK